MFYILTNKYLININNDLLILISYYHNVGSILIAIMFIIVYVQRAPPDSLHDIRRLEGGPERRQPSRHARRDSHVLRTTCTEHLVRTVQHDCAAQL